MSANACFTASTPLTNHAASLCPAPYVATSPDFTSPGQFSFFQVVISDLEIPDPRDSSQSQVKSLALTT